MASTDPMAPRHGATPTLCGALECVTIATDDGAAAAGFMTQAMRLKAVAVGHGAAVRLLVMDGGQLIRPDMDSRLTGACRSTSRRRFSRRRWRA
jgi:hypothetical protein